VTYPPAIGRFALPALGPSESPR